MKKASLFFLIPLLCLAGCLQSKEHVTIEKDGSGTLAVEMTVPEGTRELINTLMGGFVQGMAQAMQDMAQGMSKEMGVEAPKMEPVGMGSVAQEMFGNKEEILKKAKAAGLEARFLNFEKKEVGGDLHVAYTLEYDDINALAQSGIMGIKFAVARDAAGRIQFILKRDEERAAQNKAKAAQFKQRQKAPKGDGAAMPEEAREVEALMEKFSIELVVTMPNPILEMTPGVFSKKDDATAGFSVSGNFLKDPGIMDKMYFVDSQEPSIVCGAEGVTFEPAGDAPSAPKAPAAVPFAAAPAAPAPAAASSVEEAPVPDWKPTIQDAAATGKTVRILLKSGSAIEGTISEHGEDALKVECAAVPVTIFTEEIQGVAVISE